jgi:hypothetical protein
MADSAAGVAATQAPVAAAAAAASSSTSSAAAAADAASASTYALSSQKLRVLKSAFERTLDAALDPSASTKTLLAALPADIHAKHGIVLQRQAEKVLQSVRRNCLNEFEVILSEHRLPEKLGELELLETQGLLMEKAGAAAAGPTPTPEQAIRNMIHSARNTERVRLEDLAEALDQENKELQDQILQVEASLKNARLAVERKQLHVDQMYNALQA